MNRQEFSSQSDLQIREYLNKELEGCPNCHKDDECGCKGCLRRFGTRGGIYHTIVGDDQVCGHCGYQMGYWLWEDREVMRYKMNGSWNETRYDAKDLLQEYEEIQRQQPPLKGGLSNV